jgi:hypothetical protein
MVGGAALETAPRCEVSLCPRRITAKDRDDDFFFAVYWVRWERF